MAVYLQRAREEADRLRTRIACVDQLDDRRHALAARHLALPASSTRCAPSARSPCSATS
jgi:hypothetical protein